MKIQLKRWEITDLNLSKSNDFVNKNRRKDSFELETNNYFPQHENESIFGVRFKLKIVSNAFDLSLKAVYHFELIDEKITEEFKLSSFPKVNAPAIAFPYLRAFVSTLTLQAGLKTVILPSINFIRLADNGGASGEEE